MEEQNTGVFTVQMGVDEDFTIAGLYFSEKHAIAAIPELGEDADHCNRLYIVRQCREGHFSYWNSFEAGDPNVLEFERTDKGWARCEFWGERDWGVSLWPERETSDTAYSEGHPPKVLRDAPFPGCNR